MHVSKCRKSYVYRVQVKVNTHSCKELSRSVKVKNFRVMLKLRVCQPFEALHKPFTVLNNRLGVRCLASLHSVQCALVFQRDFTMTNTCSRKCPQFITRTKFRDGSYWDFRLQSIIVMSKTDVYSLQKDPQNKSNFKKTLWFLSRRSETGLSTEQ